MPEERDEIKRLFERRNGLEELARIVTIDNDELYEKVVKDMGETKVNFQSWWDRMSSKYHLENSAEGHWKIKCESCEVFLVD